MKTNDKIDAARIDLLLGELRLSGVRLIWATLAATADKEGWPAARFLAALAEQEMVERSRRRFERNLAEARLPPGKTLDTFDFDPPSNTFALMTDSHSTISSATMKGIMKQTATITMTATPTISLGTSAPKARPMIRKSQRCALSRSETFLPLSFSR
jgi:DNA replication protein DnaC